MALAMAYKLPPDYFFDREPELYLTVLKLHEQSRRTRTKWGDADG